MMSTTKLTLKQTTIVHIYLVKMICILQILQASDLLHAVRKRRPQPEKTISETWWG